MTSTTSLRDFVSHARESGRIRFADLRRLQRDILPARITTCEEAELLIALDGSVQRTDPDWSDYLIGTVRDFVVWGLPPVGAMDRDKAEWLAVLLSNGSMKTARTIAREVAREAFATGPRGIVQGQVAIQPGSAESPPPPMLPAPSQPAFV